MTKAFLYSLFLHSTIVLLVIALVWVSKSEGKPRQEKRCKIMLSQICDCAPEKTETMPPLVKKQKKPQPKKNIVKKERKKSIPSPVAEEKVAVVDEIPPEVTEPEVEEVQDETVAAEPRAVDTVETADEEADLPGVASHTPASRSNVKAEPLQKVSSEDAYLQEHVNEIMALLKKNLYYPRMARKRGIEGKVLVRFELLENGDIENIAVLEAERDVLARAAVKTIERLDGKFPLPKEPLTLQVPILYQLH